MSLNLTTFSITARDSENGTLGVAVSTKVPAVGSLCPFIRYGAGAVSTQAWVNPALGPLILDRLEAGENAAQALEHVMAAETDVDLRQVGVVDCKGMSASYTGQTTDAWAGHKSGKNYSVQGNMLVGEETLAAMEQVIVRNPAGQTLGERLLQALEAGQAAGGDRRGQQSAALIVRGPQVFPIVDLRVDEHNDPVSELRRIYEVAKVELFPFIEALPTPENPKGEFAAVRAAMAPKD